MSTDTATAPLTKADLSEEVQAIIDRAVRAARGKGWCTEFSSIAAPIFGIPANEVVDSDGFNCKGWDKDGYNRDGFDNNGWDRDGFSQDGYDREGYNREGYDYRGYNRDGIHRDGGNRFRYDEDGYDRDGYDINGNRARKNKAWYDAQAAKDESLFFYDYNWNRQNDPEDDDEDLLDEEEDLGEDED